MTCLHTIGTARASGTLPVRASLAALSISCAECMLPNTLQIKAERAAVTAKHTTAVQDLHRLPSFLRLLAQIFLQVKGDTASLGVLSL